jgi:hypothetical protein
MPHAFDEGDGPEPVIVFEKERVSGFGFLDAFGEARPTVNEFLFASEAVLL